MSIRESAHELAMSAKTGAVVSVTTTGAGAGTVLDLIPDDIGKLATVIGILLSLILIYVHILTSRKIHLEMQIMKQKEEERLQEIRKRDESGEPLRRSDDRHTT